MENKIRVQTIYNLTLEWKKISYLSYQFYLEIWLKSDLKVGKIQLFSDTKNNFLALFSTPWIKYLVFIDGKSQWQLAFLLVFARFWAFFALILCAKFSGLKFYIVSFFQHCQVHDIKSLLKYNSHSHCTWISRCQRPRLLLEIENKSE